jgi:hypothetical protein
MGNYNTKYNINKNDFKFYGIVGKDKDCFVFFKKTNIWSDEEITKNLKMANDMRNWKNENGVAYIDNNNLNIKYDNSELKNCSIYFWK